MKSKSQRFHPDQLVECLIAAFGKSAIVEFQQFLAKHPTVTKWMIVSDFVISEPQAMADAHAYTFFPYNAEIRDLKAKIAQMVPQDFKKTRTVQISSGAGKRSQSAF